MFAAKIFFLFSGRACHKLLFQKRYAAKAKTMEMLARHPTLWLMRLSSNRIFVLLNRYESFVRQYRYD
jgi:hypothetical protein